MFPELKMGNSKTTGIQTFVLQTLKQIVDILKLFNLDYETEL